jgi:hypothetical protein
MSDTITMRFIIGRLNTLITNRSGGVVFLIIQPQFHARWLFCQHCLPCRFTGSGRRLIASIDKAVGLAIGKTDLNAVNKIIGTKTAFLLVFMLIAGLPADTLVGTLSATDLDTAADALTFTTTVALKVNLLPAKVNLLASAPGKIAKSIEVKPISLLTSVVRSSPSLLAMASRAPIKNFLSKLQEKQRIQTGIQMSVEATTPRMRTFLVACTLTG